MVTITGYRTRYSAGGDKKIYFQVEGGVKTTVSQASGKAYLSALKASVFAAVDEEVAKAMIGTRLPNIAVYLSFFGRKHVINLPLLSNR